MKLVIAIVLASACSDDHSAIEHHHQPVVSKRATDAERAQLRSAIDVAMQRVKASKRDDLVAPQANLMGCDPLSTGCRHLHVDFDKWDTGDGPGSAVEPLMGVREQIEACLGSSMLMGKFSVDIDRHGKVTDATVTGVGSHHGCVEDILRGLDFPVTSLAYTVSARLTYN